MCWIAYSLWFSSYILCIVALFDFGNVIWIHRRMKNHLLNCWRNLLLFTFFPPFLSKGCLTIQVARKSNIIWVVTYAQVVASSFSASVSNIFENQRVDKSGCLSTIVGEPFIYLMSCLQIDATCKKLRYLSAGGRVRYLTN